MTQEGSSMKSQEDFTTIYLTSLAMIEAKQNEIHNMRENYSLLIKSLLFTFSQEVILTQETLAMAKSYSLDSHETMDSSIVLKLLK